ncbi:phasin family protein [Mesorhizobium sp. VNQ89]|uniref:phasin family protein n=1 Tax=Mesorhizobium quangtriensis TaxID=3157709 RepID=UPI0032B735FE
MTQTFEDAGRVGQEILDTALDSMSAVCTDARAIGLEASDYAKRVFEAGAMTLGKLMSARSLEKFTEIQTDYFRQTYEGFVAETTKLGGLYADMAKDAYRPFEAVVARAK